MAGSYPEGIEGESELDILLPSIICPSVVRPCVIQPFAIECYMPSFAIDPFAINPFAIDPFAIDAIEPYAIKRPGAMRWSRLLVKPHGPSGGGQEGDRTEGGRGSGFPTRLEDSSTTPPAYSTWDKIGEQGHPFLSQDLYSSFESSHMATNTEPLFLGDWLDAVGSLKKHTADALEADGPKKDAAPHPLMQYLYGETLAIHSEFAELFYEFVAERQNAEAALKAQVAELERKICVLKEENEQDANFLTAMTDWIGSGDRSEADNPVLPLFDWTSAPDSAI